MSMRLVKISSQKPDIGIAPLLGLTIKEYHEILLKNGAFKCGSGRNCDFKNKEDAEKALEKLEPLLIMQRLVE